MIYKCNAEGRSSKDFSNHQNLIDLFINWKDNNVNPREVLKIQPNLKSDIGKIIEGNPKSKSEDQISVIENVQFFFFDFREKIINFLKDYSILLSDAKYKTKHGRGLRILLSKQILQRLPIALAKVKADNTSENLLKYETR